MTEWQRLTNNLYVVSRELGKARDDVDRLEKEQRQVLVEIEAHERQADHTSEGAKP